MHSINDACRFQQIEGKTTTVGLQLFKGPWPVREDQEISTHWILPGCPKRGSTTPWPFESGGGQTGAGAAVFAAPSSSLRRPSVCPSKATAPPPPPPPLHSIAASLECPPQTTTSHSCFARPFATIGVAISPVNEGCYCRENHTSRLITSDAPWSMFHSFETCKILRDDRST